MKCLIITVAGMSTRFSESVGRECIKCLYNEGDIKDSILYRLVENEYTFFDRIIIVGGYKYEELAAGIDNGFKAFSDKLVMIRNEHFSDYGSGYSLLVGLLKAFELGATEILFAEGDLYVNPSDFKKVAESNKDTVTATNEVILSKKSVAFYTDLNEKIHYIYNTSHGALEIREPFTSVRNSGQIWKFMDIKRLEKICDSLTDKEKESTNLVIIEYYFSDIKNGEYDVFYFKDWLNCNTVNDYKMIRQLER